MGVTDQHRCIKESDLGNIKADVRVLVRDIAKGDERLTRLENRFEDLSNMSTAISVMSVSLEHIVEHNHKQDLMMRSQNETLSKINENLNKLNQGQVILDEKVENLEKRVNDNEDLNKIDLRQLRKETETGILRKYGLLVGIGATAAAIIMEMIKFLKTLP